MKSLKELYQDKLLLVREIRELRIASPAYNEKLRKLRETEKQINDEKSKIQKRR